MKPPRGLSAEETALWRRVTATVVPLRRTQPQSKAREDQPTPASSLPPKSHPAPGRIPVKPAPVLPQRAPAPSPRPTEDRAGLDAAWERKLARANAAPDFTLDLHGCTLDQAHARLDHGLVQAKAIGARLVLLITGKPRGADPADRGSQRGAIRAKVVDWLAAGQHGSDIAAIRGAHRRHGGEGALYLILKRRR